MRVATVLLLLLWGSQAKAGDENDTLRFALAEQLCAQQETGPSLCKIYLAVVKEQYDKLKEAVKAVPKPHEVTSARDIADDRCNKYSAYKTHRDKLNDYRGMWALLYVPPHLLLRAPTCRPPEKALPDPEPVAVTN